MGEAVAVACRERITYLMTQRPDLPSEMIEIAKAKYSGQRLETISHYQTFDLTVRTILARICAATGWLMPENTFMSNAILKEFSMYCAENCKDMTGDEILFAVRNFGLHVKDWGKAINLQLINQPVTEYKVARLELSALEETIQPRTGKDKELPAAPVDWSDTWDLLQAGDLTGINCHLISWPSIYDWLVNIGRLQPTNEVKWGYIKQQREQTIITIKNKRDAFKATQDERELAEMLKVPTWYKNTRAVNSLIAGSKRLAVEHYIQQLKQAANDEH